MERELDACQRIERSIIMPMHMHMYIISRAIRKPFAMVRGLPSARQGAAHIFCG